MRDNKYPSVVLTSKWLQSKEEGKEYIYGWQIKDAPEGFYWNTSGWNTMFRLDVDFHEALLDSIDKHKARIFGKYPVVGEVEVTWIRREDESWCLNWFNHWTFDVGQSDHDVLMSFSAYVSRYELYQDDLADRPDVPCLMGAQDEWRWKGVDGTPAPCRCEGCQSLGRIVINH